MHAIARTVVGALLVLLARTASAQVVPTPPFYGDAFEGFETHANQDSSPCLVPLAFQLRADVCGPGMMRIANGYWGTGAIFSRTGTHMLLADSGGVTFRFTQPVTHFGGWFGTIAGISGGVADLYGPNDVPLGSFPITASSCTGTCGWSWNGFAANGGRPIARIDLQSNAAGGSGLALDDLVARFGAEPGVWFCFADGPGNVCPCFNEEADPQRGCYNSTFHGARLSGTGTPSLANDDVVLTADGMPPNATALFFQGTARIQGGAGVMFGDGLRCVGGTITRLGIHVSSGGVASHPAPGGVPIHVGGAIASPGTYRYQVWYRDPSPAFCPPATFNLTGGYEIDWLL
jgi:hypothetical protein